MADDWRLFNDYETGKSSSTFRIYSWQPNCISLGYAQRIEKMIDLEKAKQLNWDVVRRPTGGGIVFHNEAEVTYSLVTDINNPMFPKGLVPAYRKISEAVVFALGKLGITAEIRNTKFEYRNKSEIRRPNKQNHLCFSFPAEYEVVVDGRKIVGSAQKRGKKALLQQGSIFVRRNSAEVYSALKQPGDDSDSISVEEVLGGTVLFKELSKALIDGFKNVLGIEFT